MAAPVTPQPTIKTRFEAVSAAIRKSITVATRWRRKKNTTENGDGDHRLTNKARTHSTTRFTVHIVQYYLHASTVALSPHAARPIEASSTSSVG